MITNIAQILIGILGAVVILMTLWGLLDPPKLLELARRFLHDGAGFWVAVAGRLVFGAALIAAAPVSRWPLAFEILGWVAIAAAVGLLLMGRERLGRLIDWFAALRAGITRTWLLGALAFGAFLVAGVM